MWVCGYGLDRYGYGSCLRYPLETHSCMAGLAGFFGLVGTGKSKFKLRLNSNDRLILTIIINSSTPCHHTMQAQQCVYVICAPSKFLSFISCVCQLINCFSSYLGSKLLQTTKETGYRRGTTVQTDEGPCNALPADR